MKWYFRKFNRTFSTIVMFIGMSGMVFSQSLVFDRGLPTHNLNNAAGSSRSNVAWAFGALGTNDWVSGDDFSIGSPGEKWLITKLRGWSIQGTPGVTALGDRFQSVTLYGGEMDAAHLPLIGNNFTQGMPFEALISGELELGSNVNSNPDISHTAVQYEGGIDYQGSSTSFIQLWQHDFNLSWVVDGGQQYVFAADGILQTGVSYLWFNHASNASFSGSPQDGSDGLVLVWPHLDLTWMYVFDSNGNGWDKSSDLNVQIFAKQIANDREACKKNGWKNLYRQNGSAFKNQGDCIQYVNTGK